MWNLGLNLLKYAPRAVAGVRSILGDPVKSSGLITGGILGGKATNDTINSGILGDTNLMEEGMNFFSSPAISYLKDIRNTPSGSVLAPDQDAIDKENEFNKELNTKITTASEDNQSNILITPEVEQQSGLLSTPENNPIDFSNTTPLPDQSLLSDYIMTASEAEEPTTTDEGLLSETKNPYYSVLAENVLDMNFTSGTGDQILNQIINMPGVKKSELEDTGLSTFLSGKSKVTKEELDNYILENNISTKINDTFLSDGGVLVGGKIDITPDYLRNAQTLDKAVQLVQNRDELYDDFMRLGEQGLFGSAGEGVSFNEFISDSDMETEVDLIKEYLEVRHNLREVTGDNTTYKDYTMQGGKNYKELIISVPTDGFPYIPPHFTSQVPEGENLIGHARFNERVIDGKKTLFIEEIQSDLHQKGRKNGYRDGNNSLKISNLEKRRDEIDNKRLEILNNYNNLIAENKIDEAKELDDDIKELLYSVKSHNEEINRLKNLAPDAPFKKNWHELLMKRLIKYAVDNDFEAISFTPGKIQNQRYDLSQFIDKVEVVPSLYSANKIDLRTFDKTDLLQTYSIKPEQLESYVGKELSEKILKDIKDSNNFNNFNLEEYLKTPENDSSGADFIKEYGLVYDNTDLEIGGEGMVGFYDKILPSFLNKFSKKYGTSVGQSSIPGLTEQARRPGNIQVEEVYDAVGQNGKVFASYEIKMIKDPKTGMNEKYQVIQTKNGTSNVIAETRNAIEGKKIIIDELEGFDVPQFFERKETIPFMIITPKMKEEIGKKGINIAKLNSGLLSVA